MMNTEVVNVYRMETFKNRVDQLNKKAAKLGFNPISYTVGDEITWYDDIAHEVLHRGWEVEVTYDFMKLPGDWRLVAIIDHKEDLIKTLPGETVPTIYRERGPICDHCGQHRNRNETFVLRVDEAYIQVGRQCIAEFLGIDAAQALGQIDLVGAISELDDYLGEPEVFGFKLEVFLAHTACMMRMFGWQSRSGASFEVMATADRVWWNLTEKNESKVIKPNNDDVELAKETGVWMQALVDKDDLNDYLYNLASICKNGFVTFKSAGFAASAINAMLKDKEEKLAAKLSNKQHIGVVGDKIIARLTLISSNGFDSGYGYSFFHRFVDELGNVLIWKTAKELTSGKQYEVVGTIKKHDYFKSEPQTVITRCKVQILE